ncbi:MAG: hypothetical protein JOY71_08555 [Acetobacteraceae bacterium]|nr:hypothetical protein [Acetobacteraceae bacterium]
MAALAFSISTAFAQERPLLLPTRDVDITYDLGSVPGSPGRVLRQRVRWLASDRKMRIDPPSPGLFAIIDYNTGRMIVLRASDHLGLESQSVDDIMPRAGRPLATPTYVRRGQDQLAGLSCTDWEMRDGGGTPLSLCITSDGVLLRVRSGTRALATAIAVHFGSQDVAAFQIPPGYRVQPGP